jgi:hypothetical protein
MLTWTPMQPRLGSADGGGGESGGGRLGADTGGGARCSWPAATLQRAAQCTREEGAWRRRLERAGGLKGDAVLESGAATARTPGSGGAGLRRVLAVHAMARWALGGPGDRAWSGLGQKQELGRAGPRENEGDWANERKNLSEVHQTSRSWAESLTGPERGKENETGNEFLFIFRIYFREENYLEITR